jgi:hypothetical protein
MIIKYSRIPSFMFIVVSLAVGTPLILALAKNAIEPKYNWIAWTFVFIAALALLRGIKLLMAPPTVLEINTDGIQIYYKFGRSFTKDADLMPWRLIEKMQLIRVNSKDNSFNWAIELTLSAPPPFDATKRNALQNEILHQSNPNIFYIDTFVLDHPREKVLAALQSSWRHWQDMAEQGKHG